MLLHPRGRYGKPSTWFDLYKRTGAGCPPRGRRPRRSGAAARIPRWFLPVSGELRPGGRYQLEGNAGGTIERCDPPSSFTATWEYGGHVSWIELRLTAAADGATRFELQHISRADDETWAQFGPGAVGVGWDLATIGLGQHLAGADDVDSEAARAWSVSEEGRRFAMLSSRSWGEAAVAAGTDPVRAEAWTARTTAFYTGAEAPAGA
jgi:hypothetical protein